MRYNKDKIIISCNSNANGINISMNMVSQQWSIEERSVTVHRYYTNEMWMTKGVSEQMYESKFSLSKIN